MTRDGKRQPLAIGAALKDKDELATGANARLLLRLGDGSVVKLGEHAKLQLSGLMQNRKQGFIAATLKVVEGAFRFTTSAAAKARATRNVSVQLPTLTAGIRGTDIWGKNFGDKEIIVLIEGKITLTRAGEALQQMNEPMTVFQAPNSGPATREAVVLEQLKAWAAETEIEQGQGSLRKGGRWKLYVGSYAQQLQALNLYESLRREGYPARIQPQENAEGQVYRVRLAGFASRQEADAIGARLKQDYPELTPVSSLQ